MGPRLAEQFHFWREWRWELRLRLRLGLGEGIAESEEKLSLYSCHPFFHFTGGGLIEFWVEV